MTKQIVFLDIQSVFHEEKMYHGIQKFVDDTIYLEALLPDICNLRYLLL